jgi:P-type Cu2+ transporter
MTQDQQHRAKHSAGLLRPSVFRNYLFLASPFAIASIVFDPLFGLSMGLVPSAAPAILLGLGSGLLATLTPILRTAVAELSSRRPSGAVLTSIALITLFGLNLTWSVTALVGAEPTFASGWWQFALVVLLVLLGNWLASRAFKRIDRIKTNLGQLLPKSAQLLDGDQVREVAADQLRIGDLIEVRPGQIIAADGKVLSGSADVNDFVITGSNQAVFKSEGSPVWAGTQTSADAKLGQGILQIEVERAGSATHVGAQHRLLLSAESKPSKLEQTLHDASVWVFYAAVLISVIVLAATVAIDASQLAGAITGFAAALLIFSPQNLKYVVAPVVISAIHRAGKTGLQVQDRASFEALTKADAVVFDKTGTLTTAERSFVRARLTHNSPLQNIDELIALAAGVEVFAKHSVAARIVAEAQMRRLEIPEILDFRVIPGQGVTGILDGSTIIVGGAALLTGRNIDIFVGDLVQADQANQSGNSVIFVIRDSELLGYIELSDIIRPNADSVVTQLHLRKKRVVLITGDAHGVADFVARQLGIAEVYGELVPIQKAKTIDQLKADGSVIAMVGDAENDLESLERADIAIAVGVDAHVDSEAAGLILNTLNPMAVVHAIDLSSKASRAIRANLIWFVGATLVLLPIAIGAAGLPASPLLAVAASFVPVWGMARSAGKFLGNSR